MENGNAPENKDFVVLRSDRRKNLRKQLLVLRVKGEDSRGVFFGYAKTLGRGGMFIASVNPRPLGEEFEIRFTLTGIGEEFRCRATVAWRREYDPTLKTEPGMGIRFVDLDENKRQLIDEWMKKR